MSMNVSGLISGLDTDNIISQLMAVERQPINLMETRQHTYELRKSLWNEINSSLLSLKTKGEAIATSEDLLTKKATSSDDTYFTAAAGSSAADGTYAIDITTIAKAQRVNGTTQSAEALNLSGTFTIGDGTYSSTIEVYATDTLSTIMSRINEAKDDADPTKSLDVSATIVNNTLVLQHKETGSANQLVLTDTVNTAGSTGSDEILESLGILTDAKTIQDESQAAADAVFTVNGIAVTRSSNSGLTDVISGVTLSLKQEGVSGTLMVEKDVDAMVNSIKSWVEQYNSTIELLSTRLSEEVVKGAESDAMKSRGLLRGNSILSSTKSELRQNISSNIEGLTVYTNLSQIGIMTTSSDYGKSGKLEIDETELRAALEANPEDVAKLFVNDEDLDGDGEISSDEQGVITRLESQLDYLTSTSTKTIGGVTVKAGVIQARIEYESAVISDLADKIADYEERLAKREQSLYAQFTAMETALSNLQNQASYLSSQLMSLYSE
ncbi:flagellar filament capping protein FliD [Phosphitispora sp. TUW77]|uniref:flagellar filament capping protein FliD n=1 Tax=Phosphitispora sp. TUW77 TaxID=3152361 RepID=UPI003AB1C4BC